MKALDLKDLNPEPIKQFESWFKDAEAEKSIAYPEAMAVSTIDSDGYPDNRLVLMKHFSTEGFIFNTNLNSAKGQALKANPKAALTFYWMPLDKQIRIKGDVEICSEEYSDKYFATRPRQSQLGAWASKQSEVLESREALEKRVAEVTKKYEDKEVPRPPHWRGVLVKPVRYQFWLQRDSRLHDSFVYLPNDKGGWEITRRYP